MIEAHVSRRDVLKFSALGAAALTLPLERVVRAKTVSQIAASKLPAPYTRPFAVPEAIDARKKDAVVKLVQAWRQVEILPGYKTTIFGYGTSAQAVATPGPTIHTQRGAPITVMHSNQLPRTHPFLGYDPWTSTHLHGSASKPQYDGYASDITRVGQTKRYLYPNKQDARTLWYHDHGVHHTAENAYMGLAAQYHLHDDVEQGVTPVLGKALELPIWKWDRQNFSPSGVALQYDLPLILADKMFAANGEFRYDDAGHTGLWGDVILVNGVPWPNLKVTKRLYRFRVLNASISRGYRMQLSNGAPFSVIGTDGGLMPQVQQTTQLRIGMAERYEIVIDFSKYTKGTKIQLLNLGVPNSTDFDNTGKIMQFEVVDDGFDPANNALPTGGLYSLNPNKDVWDLKENAIQGTTKIEVLRQNGEWKIQSTSTNTASSSGSGSSGSGSSGSGGSGSGSSGSGGSGSGGGTTKLMTWEDIIASGYREVVANPASGDVQIWEITNRSGGWFHPVHIHLVDFKMLTRNGKPVYNYEQGPKDVAYVGENETIRAIMKFGAAGDSSTDGRYMIHCHNLPHEDHDMMTQFRVGADVDRDKTVPWDDPKNEKCNDPIDGDEAK
jgi:FtsP/CotA-like multicopper oxidase with cupredoxin domain